jgi:hypothetical protein
VQRHADVRLHLRFSELLVPGLESDFAGRGGSMRMPMTSLRRRALDRAAISAVFTAVVACSGTSVRSSHEGILPATSPSGVAGSKQGAAGGGAGGLGTRGAATGGLGASGAATGGGSGTSDAGSTTGLGGMAGLDTGGGGFGASNAGSAGLGGSGGGHRCNGFPLPGGPPPSGACSVEGDLLSGFQCGDELGDGSNWNTLCCDGEWNAIALPRDGSTPTCAPLAAGDDFPCGFDGLRCVVGESYCSETQENLTGLITNSTTYTCQPICPAGDCSCFCAPDDMGQCDYDPLDKVCPADVCACFHGLTDIGLRDPGAVTLECTYDHPTSSECEREPDIDAACSATSPGSIAYLCEGAMPGFGCWGLETAQSCGTEADYVCCYD